MFTGIIKDIGEVVSFSKNAMDVYRLVIKSNRIHPGVDDSIAVNGVCQTVVKIDDYLHFDVVASTLKKTNFLFLARGMKVNLEPALVVGSRVDGHFVTGHVNTCGKVKKIIQHSKSFELCVTIPRKYNKYVCEEGSICINGVSLTIDRVIDCDVYLFIIPHSWNNTSFKHLIPGESINIEFDILIKYLERLAEFKKTKSVNESLINEILK